MPLYPLFADLEGRDVLVVGGGEVGARKIAALLRAGAHVRLHAQAILHEDVAAAVADGRVIRLAGEFDPAWLDTVWLVVAATDDTAFNAGLAAEAGRRRRLINVVDDAALSTFQVPAVVDRSPLVLAISSGGAAPMLARRLRERLETLVAPELGTIAALFGRHRERIRQALPDMKARRRWFELMLDGRLERSGHADASAAIETVFLRELDRLDADAAPVAGSVSLVQASDTPDLYTLRALRVLNEADVLVLSPDVEDAALELARRDATRLRAMDAATQVVARAGEGARVVYIYVRGAAHDASVVVASACHHAGLHCRHIAAAEPDATMLNEGAS